MDINILMQNTAATLMAAAWKIAGAFALWLVGRWLIAFCSRTLERQQFDVTLTGYLQTGLSVLLNVALIVAILGFFGVETTTFAALLAAGGVARADCSPISRPERSSCSCAPSRWAISSRRAA